MKLDYVTDEGSGARARIGLIALHVDETLETEIRPLLDVEGVALYCTRVQSGAELNEHTLAESAARIPDAARLLPPNARMDVVAYACTSGATIIGPDKVARAIRQSRPADAPGSFAQSAVTDPLSAVKAACAHLGIKRLGFVTPYIASVSAAMRTALEAEGIEIIAFGSFEQSEEHLVARISPGSVREALLRVGKSAACDGVFASCTNLRTLGVLQETEDMLGIPVLSSNQALAWHILRLAGVSAPRPGAGALMADY
jgi:maleate isomerase